MRQLISKQSLSIIHHAAGLAFGLALFGGDLAQAQTRSSSTPARNAGGVPVRIDGGPPARCINGSTDQVWLKLHRVVMTKKSEWWGLSANNQAQVVITVQVKTRPAATQTLSYPLSAKVNIRDYETGQVSLPVEYMLIDGLELKQKDADKKDVYYTGLGVDTTVINVKSAGALGATLSALAELTGSKKLPIPDTPYTQAAGYLLDFANKAVTNEINGQNADEKYATASLALAFDPDGNCNEDGQGFETTGVKAILMAEGNSNSPAYVPIDQVGDYCWTAETKPAFVLKAAKKVGGKNCADASYAALYKTITNNYVAYMLNKRTLGGHLGPSQARQDIQESKQLCDALNTEDCPAARP